MILAKGGSTPTNITRWIGRILSVPPVAFYILLLVGHLFGGEEATGPIAMRDLVSLVLLVVFTSIMFVALIIGWRWEGVGGIVTTSCAIILYIALAIGIKRNGIYVAAIVTIPFLLPGVLFLCSWLRARKEAQ